jgi:hypothetical protein
MMVAELRETDIMAGGVWTGSGAMRLGLRLTWRCTICRVTVGNVNGDLFILIVLHDLRNLESN